jgi:hypothetical protein
MPSRDHSRSSRCTLLVFAAAAVLLQPLPVRAQVATEDWCRDAGRNQHCELRHFRFAARAAELNIDVGPNGGIEVEGYQGSDIRVTARVVARARTADAAADMARRVEIRAADGQIRATGPRQIGRDGWSVSVRVQVPVGTAVSARTTNGGIVISATNADVRAHTTNGAIRLTDVGGRIHAQSTNGTIRAAMAPQVATIQSVELRTTNGSVTLTVPERASAQVELSTTNGSITTDLPLTVRGQVNRRRVSGALGSGGPPLRVSTTNGSIRLGGH